MKAYFDLHLVSQALEKCIGRMKIAQFLDLQLGEAVLPMITLGYLSLQFPSHLLLDCISQQVTHSRQSGRAHLKTITYTQNWNSECEDIRINVGRITIIDGVRRTGENNS